MNVSRIDAPSNGCCVTPSTASGRVDAGGVEDGRHEVDRVHELVAHLAPRVDAARGQCTISGVRVPPSHV